MNRMTPHSLMAASLVMLLVGAIGANSNVLLPPVQRSGSVEFLSGGIGHDEAQAMQKEARQWPLALEFAVKAGPRSDYAANVVVQIHDAKGHTALEATSTGPFLLARLAPGAYKIDASLGGRTLHREVQVQANHPASVLFLWPPSPGGADL